MKLKLVNIYKNVLNESTQAKFIAYHGTNHDINKFSDSFLAGEKVTQHHGAGIYFATSYENARMFGKNIYKVELSGNFISEDNPTSDVDPDKLIELMKLSDEDEWELEAQNYHPDPEVGLMVALEDALKQENEAAAFMRLQTGGWYMHDGLGYVRAMTKIGIDGVIVNPPENWVNQKHIIMFNPNAIKFIEKVNVNEELTYRHASTEGVEDDEYEIGMVKEDYDLSNLSFNDGKFNKLGVNTIYMDDNPIVDFGVGQLGQVNINGKVYENAMYLQGGFNASMQRKGYGTLALKFIFSKLPKIQYIILQCVDSAKPFWDKMGGKVIAEKPYGRSTKSLYTMIISRDDFL